MTSDQVQSALDRFDLGQLVAAERANQGLSGRNLMVESTHGRFVLRLSAAALLRAEQYFIERLAMSAPTPFPFLVEESRELFGWSYALMPRLPGVDCARAEAWAELSAIDRRSIARAMGRALAQLHELRFPAPGRYNDLAGDVVPFDLAHADRVRTGIELQLERCAAVSPASPPRDVVWALRRLHDWLPALEVPFEPTLVHHDFTRNNLVVLRSGRGWRVSGVFDFPEAYAGDPIEDLPRAAAELYGLDPALAREFMRTYLRGRPKSRGLVARFMAYLLHDRLVIWEYGQQHQIWFAPEQRLRRDWLQPFFEVDWFARTNPGG